MTKLKILIADDHPIILDGLRGLINDEPDMHVIGQAADGHNAVQQAFLLSPDIVVMDISMPGMSGDKATERIKQKRPEIKVIALTAYEDKGYIGQMLQAGASGYVLKLAAAEELIKAIRIVAAGQSYLDPTVSGKIVDSFIRQKSIKARARSGTLTGREEEVLQLVAQGYINKEIGAQLGISVKTVETHKSNMMEKLGFHSRAEIVRYALGQGWLSDK